MPYDLYTVDDGEEKMDVALKCSHKECFHYEDAQCTAEADIHDLDPTDVSCCDSYDIRLENGQEYLFGSLDELNCFVASNEEIQFIEVDDSCTRLFCVALQCNVRGHMHVALIQITKESQNSFDFRPKTDGGILLVPKAQVDLAL